MKQAGDEGITPEQARFIQSWSDTIYKIAIQEMLHLALACNLLTAVGGAPNLRRPNFPQLQKYYSLGIMSTLAPFSDDTLCRYICWEKPEWPGWWDAFCDERMDSNTLADISYLAMTEMLNPEERPYKTIGELYEIIDSAFDTIPAEKLFIGPQSAQMTNAYIPFVPPLIAVKTPDDAHRAIELIIIEGEGIGAGDRVPPSGEPSKDCHFSYFTAIREQLLELKKLYPDFRPAWPAIDNPLFDFHKDGAVPGAHIITEPLTRDVGEIFTATYDLMIQMLMRLFAHTEESEEQLKTLATAVMSIMTGAIRPLGVMLTRLPAGKEYPHRTAGPSFELYLSTQPLPHMHSAWSYFCERLVEITDACDNLMTNPNAPPNLIEVRMVLQYWEGQFALPAAVLAG